MASLRGVGEGGVGRQGSGLEDALGEVEDDDRLNERADERLRGTTRSGRGMQQSAPAEASSGEGPRVGAP